MVAGMPIWVSEQSWHDCKDNESDYGRFCVKLLPNKEGMKREPKVSHLPLSHILIKCFLCHCNVYFSFFCFLCIVELLLCQASSKNNAIFYGGWATLCNEWPSGMHCITSNCHCSFPEAVKEQLPWCPILQLSEVQEAQVAVFNHLRRPFWETFHWFHQGLSNENWVFPNCWICNFLNSYEKFN